MPYTLIQQLRKARAKNKGTNVKMATSLRNLAEMLDKKGPEEFTNREILKLELTKKLIGIRLTGNRRTKLLSALVAKVGRLDGKIQQATKRLARLKAPR